MIEALNLFRQFVAPPLYIQGEGAIGELAAIARRLGKRALVVTDPGVEALLGARLREVLGAAIPLLILRKEITPLALAELTEKAKPHGADVVLGVGGGKALDAGKAVARNTGARFISVPTAASNDAPTSQAIALYGDDDHRFMVESLGRNPDAVVVDTAIIAAAPAHFLRCGIGDALAKAIEAEGCAASAKGRTPLGAKPAIAGLALAQACREVLHADAVAALRAAGTGNSSPALEAVIEAVILMSGLGFENGGLGIAHAMTRGLILAERTKRHAHGEHVGYGLLVQMALDGSARELNSERDFVQSLGLPFSLAAFGGGPVEAAEISFLAEQAMTAPQHILNYRRGLQAADLVQAIRRLEAL
jgi:glycerol dehydrogenase